MKFTPLEIPDVVLIEPTVFGDQRGFFMETWREDLFVKNDITATFIQDNHSLSVQGVLRGLHYQIKQPQGKLGRVISGEVFDVAVDIRKSSPTFGRWVGEIISAENKRMMWVPPGFAHGFYVTSKTAEFVYKSSNYYAPQHERTITWNDPDICIKWPLVGNSPPQVSQKDLCGSSLNDAEVFT